MYRSTFMEWLNPFALFREVPSTLEITRRAINYKHDIEWRISNEEKRKDGNMSECTTHEHEERNLGEKSYTGFEILTAVITNSSIFWDITPCRPMKVKIGFGGTYRLHLQGIISRTRRRHEAGSKRGCDMFLRNVASHSLVCTTRHSKRQKSLKKKKLNFNVLS
jgi:hypothetical protein